MPFRQITPHDHTSILPISRETEYQEANRRYLVHILGILLFSIAGFLLYIVVVTVSAEV